MKIRRSIILRNTSTAATNNTSTDSSPLTDTCTVYLTRCYSNGSDRPHWRRGTDRFNVFAGGATLTTTYCMCCEQALLPGPGKSRAAFFQWNRGANGVETKALKSSRPEWDAGMEGLPELFYKSTRKATKVKLIWSSDFETKSPTGPESLMSHCSVL